MEFNQALRLAFVAFAANEGNFVMKKIASLLLVGAAFASYCAPVLAADLPPEEPPVVIDNPPVVVEAAGGWYIRGDVDYGLMRTKGIDYDVLTSMKTFDNADLKGAFSVGGGIGYQLTDHFRTDFTLDYHLKSNLKGSTSGNCVEWDGVTVDALGNPVATETGSCVSSDNSSVRIITAMANAYVDLGNYHGFTPYVGAGIGGAHVAWDKLTNIATCTPSVATQQCSDGASGWGAAGGTVTQTAYDHQGISGMRFAWALAAGASYDLSSNLKLDAGYRWTHINGGDMFRFKGLTNHADDIGVMGKDRGINIHEARIGLRYQFGGGMHHGGGYDSGPVYK
jgi:opacity protein-like surface antigen